MFVGANGWAVGYRGIEGGDAATKPVFNVRKLKKRMIAMVEVKMDSNGGPITKWTFVLYGSDMIPRRKHKSNNNGI